MLIKIRKKKMLSRENIIFDYLKIIYMVITFNFNFIFYLIDKNIKNKLKMVNYYLQCQKSF